MRHAEISGAGLAGLSAAAALARSGWSVRVHERSDELREIGAGIFMWENGLRVLEALGAYDEAILGGERNEYWEIRDERARILHSGWMMQGARLITILRQRLHQSLANAAIRAGAEIVTKSEIVGADASGALIRKDGARFPADLAIGADGYNSAVRRSLNLTRRQTDLQDGCGRFLIARKEGDPVGRCLEYWQGGRRVGIVPVNAEQIYIYLCCPASDVKGRAGAADRDEWSRSFPQLKSFFDRLEDNGRWAPFFDVTCSQWSSGRVALVGDAAHSMSPNLGQGACVAMQSAFALSKQVAKADDVETALRSWEAAQRPTVDATQRFSRLYGRIGTRWPKPLLDLRSALVWSVGRSPSLQRRINVAAHSDATA
ncbi:FAD-dependent oxidoreductase [Hansschlegelia quercus]|uniref:FAD-dependent monooxygenase n=1 Tax=Hansschlegelia quercus TaxID=2528245 RepID=A0A4Q9GHJ4_9HYPH|nr:NAD(P)/FAD-dependent oxidoreductase [Hansschlegelia quercus]TBN53468.1 FAD-dependent monooxygenase [Hansschlegelia quercus]